MSEGFFIRMEELLPELLRVLDESEKKEFDREIERITGRDCDEVAASVSDQEFQRLARIAYVRVKKKREKTPESDIAAYA